MSQWYALCTAPRRETVVASGLAERGFTFFLPMAMVNRGSPSVPHHEPLIPGYVLVLCDPDDFANLHGLEGIQGFVRYLRADGAMWPFPFPPSEILRVQIEERAGNYDFTRSAKPQKFRPLKGDTVRIAAGPYFDFLATVLKTPQGDRCSLLIQHEGFEAPRKRTEDVAHLAAA